MSTPKTSPSESRPETEFDSVGASRLPHPCASVCLILRRSESALRRFLQHVLPSRWRRVRTYGWLSPAARKRFEAIHAMLTANGGDDRPARPALTVAMLCPHCQKPMRHIARIERGPPPAIRSFHPP